ncbi:hypothetical protein YPPY14_2308, partial [Yersinia pestis PY-14]
MGLITRISNSFAYKV